MHVILVRLPDDVQYFSRKEVLPQQEQDRVIYKPCTRSGFDYQNVWTVRWRGQWALAVEAICWRIDLSGGVWYLNNPAAAGMARQPELVIFYAQSIFLQHVAAVRKWLFKCLIINSPWKKSSRVTSRRCAECDCAAPQDDRCWRILQAVNRAIFHENTPSVPCLFFVPKPAYRSILLTIQIVIDLPYLSPAAPRSHWLSLPYWKGKHSWGSRPICLMLGCSVGAMCLLLPPWWMNEFTLHIYSNTSHLLISGWRFD